MPLKLNVTGDAQTVNLDFNQAAGLKALDVKNKFIGIDTSTKAFQDIFKGYPKVQKIFNGGYSENFSYGFKKSGAKIEASGELILAKVYAKAGLLVESAGYNLGGVKIGVKQTGSTDLLAFVPSGGGNGIELSAKTISAFSGNPSLSVKLPEAYLKASLLANIDIGALAFDGKIKGSLGKISKTIDLPRFGVFSGIKTAPPISISLVDLSIKKIIEGKATGIYGKKQTSKGILESEYEGIKLTSDLRNISKRININSNGSLSGEIPLFKLGASLNKLGAKAFPYLNLLAKRIEGSGYVIDYKLLDLSIESSLKIKYNGKLNLSEQSSSVTFENSKSLTLSGTSNGSSNSIEVLNTTELKKFLDTDGDGKATVKFDWGYNKASYVLNYGLYADLSATLEAGKFKVNIGTEIKLGFKTIRPNTDLVDISLFNKRNLQILKDFKLVGGSATIPIPTNNYRFSKTTSFNVPTNADDLINLLGLNPNDFYIIKGTNSNDALVTRTERGNDTFYGYAGVDTMSGGLGNDIYWIDNVGDVVIENTASGIDIVQSSSSSYTLGSNVENLNLIGNGASNGYGNDLDNVITGNDAANLLEGRDGADQLLGNSGSDTLKGEGGNDTLSGGEGIDTVSYDNSLSGVVVNIDEAQNYQNPGGSFDTTIVSTSLIPTDTEPNFTIAAGKALDGFGTTDTLRNLENIIGSGFDDVLIGNNLGNSILGLVGNDLLVGNAGNDSLDGGDGIDTVSYRRDPSSVTVNLEQNQATDGFGTGGYNDDGSYNYAGTDQIFNVENVIGSAFRDEIIGDARINIIHAGDGDDVVNARDGNDIIFGEGGKDSLDGENGDDFLIGGTDADLLDGREGNDYLDGGTGNDRLYDDDGDNIFNGGTGEDTLYGGSGRDMFVLTSESGSDTIFNFTVGSDYLGLLNGLTFEQITITQGIGTDTSNTLVSKQDGELLATLIGVQANTLSLWDFTNLG
ncbi:MAG: calcium-binding protein [Nostoc sp. CmiVER01]|uniref:calcium-binding protein n=1 Tax=Nostoc sp. CmiVER01 TaxID=3075384 RepID=UPI002AD34D2F|nr:calcium-binding protein [Nostoc sp. CmiVER01]MDZ8121445.1 calcium-binding protein [Nostoc sp. CmiVER01]